MVLSVVARSASAEVAGAARTSPVHRRGRPVAAATAPAAAEADDDVLSRRGACAAAAAAAAASAFGRPEPARAAYGEASTVGGPTEMSDKALKVYYGAANPPATYGGVGGTTRKAARYSFEHPEEWGEEAPSKIQKGTGGIDAIFRSPRGDASIIVLTLKREGEDNSAFNVSDPKKALLSLSGADSGLQDSLGGAKATVEAVSKPSADGGRFFEFDLPGSVGGNPYAISMNVNEGRLFAAVVTGSPRAFASAPVASMIKSFKTYRIDEDEAASSAGGETPRGNF